MEQILCDVIRVLNIFFLQFTLNKAIISSVICFMKKALYEGYMKEFQQGSKTEKYILDSESDYQQSKWRILVQILSCNCEGGEIMHCNHNLCCSGSITIVMPVYSADSVTPCT